MMMYGWWIRGSIKRLFNLYCLKCVTGWCLNLMFNFFLSWSKRCGHVTLSDNNCRWLLLNLMSLWQTFPIYSLILMLSQMALHNGHTIELFIVTVLLQANRWWAILLNCMWYYRTLRLSCWNHRLLRRSFNTCVGGGTTLDIDDWIQVIIDVSKISGFRFIPSAPLYSLIILTTSMSYHVWRNDRLYRVCTK